MFVDCFVVSLFLFASGIGLDADFGSELSGSLADCVGIVRGVSNDGAHFATFEIFQQPLSQRSITALAGRQFEGDQPAVSASDGVNFRGQSTARTAQAASFVSGLFFSSAWRRPVEAIG